MPSGSMFTEPSELTRAGRSVSSNAFASFASGSTAASAAIFPAGSVMTISRSSFAGLVEVSISKIRLPRKKLSSTAYTIEPDVAATRPDSADHGIGVPSARLADSIVG